MPQLSLEKQLQYSSFNNYLEYLKSNFRINSVIRKGHFYTYLYKFGKDYPDDILKYFDWWPLTFIFDVNYDKKYFVGMNLHHMPVLSRQIWVSRLKKVSAENFENNKQPIRINYPSLISMFKKSGFIVRNYRMDRVNLLRKVQLNSVDEVVRYYSDTYYKVSYEQSANRYRSLR